MPRSIWLRVAGLATLCLALSTPQVAAAAPAKPSVSSAIPAPEEQSNLLSSLVEEARQNGSRDPGFATVRADAATGTVTVYRTGGRAGAKEFGYDDLAAARVRVAVEPALMSAAETEALMTQIRKAWPGLADAGVEITQVTTDGTGPVTIGVAALNDQARALVDRFNTYGAGTVQVEQRDYVVPATRQDDYSPYYGGGRIKYAGASPGQGCSSGFGAYSNGNGAHYLLTAYHCVVRSDPRFWDGGDDYMGTATAVEKDYDAAAIKVASSPRIWDGPWNSTTYTKQVTATRAPYNGMSVCTSGSFSGVRCTGTVHGVGYFTLTDSLNGGGTYLARLWYADGNNGVEMAGEGDSGGPVFYPVGNQVTAVGLVSAINTFSGVPCVGVGNRLCSSRVYFPDVTTVARMWTLDLTR